MDIRTYRLCLVAYEMMSMHGRFFAAAFLAENNVRIENALLVVTLPRTVFATSVKCHG